MRQVGLFTNEQHAAMFVDVLTAHGMSAVCEPQDGQWEVWIRDEDRVAEARTTFEAFRADPDGEAFRAAVAQGQQVRRQAQERRRQAASNYVDVRRQVFQQSSVQRAPLTMILMGIAVLVALVTNFGAQRDGLVYRTLGFVDGQAYRLQMNSESVSGLANIQNGEVWRLITPIFLHFSIVHLIFNLYWLYTLGGRIENRHGPIWLGAVVLVAAVAGNLGHYLIDGNPFFGGLSGVAYGLLAYIWVRMQFAPREHLAISKETVVFMVLLLVIGFTGVLDGLAGGRVANWVHLFGFLGGAAVAWLQPVNV